MGGLEDYLRRWDWLLILLLTWFHISLMSRYSENDTEETTDWRQPPNPSRYLYVSGTRNLVTGILPTLIPQPINHKSYNPPDSRSGLKCLLKSILSRIHEVKSPQQNPMSTPHFHNHDPKVASIFNLLARALTKTTYLV